MPQATGDATLEEATPTTTTTTTARAAAALGEGWGALRPGENAASLVGPVVRAPYADLEKADWNPSAAPVAGDMRGWGPGGGHHSSPGRRS